MRIGEEFQKRFQLLSLWKDGRKYSCFWLHFIFRYIDYNIIRWQVHNDTDAYNVHSSVLERNLKRTKDNYCCLLRPLNSASKNSIHILSRFSMIWVPLSKTFSIAATSIFDIECLGPLKCCPTLFFAFVLTGVLCSKNLFF